MSVSGSTDIECINTEEITIGREGQVKLTDKRLSRVHCKLLITSQATTVLDLSSNGTYVNGAKLGKGQQRALANGDKVALVPEGYPNPITYVYLMPDDIAVAREPANTSQDTPLLGKRKRPEDDSAADEAPDTHLVCSICHEVLHQTTTLSPCLHDFCGGCVSDWFKHGNSTCPECR